MRSRCIQIITRVLPLMLLLIVPFGICGEVPPQEELRRDFPFVVLAEDHINLGNLSLNVSASGTITLHNTGAKPLLIATVRSSCGLMTPSWPTRAIEPGQQVTISFRYDAQRVGPFERIITIHTNAWQKTLTVKVSGMVLPAVSDIPQ